MGIWRRELWFIIKNIGHGKGNFNGIDLGEFSDIVRPLGLQ
jgi:hypothetical protein